MSYITQGQLAQDGDFKLQVKIAMIISAKTIVIEEQTNFISYEKRHGYAVQILNDPEYKINAFSFICASNPVIAKASIDNDIQNTVNDSFDSLAGVKPSDYTTEINKVP